MLLLHRLFIRLALAFLIAGIALGAGLEVWRGLGATSWPFAVVTLHTSIC